MTLQEMIGHRRSCRSYRSEAVDGEQLEKILSFEMKPLYPGKMPVWHLPDWPPPASTASRGILSTKGNCSMYTAQPER